MRNKDTRDRSEYRKKYRRMPGVKERLKEARQRYEKTPKGMEARRRYNLKKRYGLDWDVYNELLEKQRGRCAICFEIPKKGYTLSVDHCHKTNTVRGILCNPCNTAIGLLGHSVLALQEAIRYLENDK